MQCVQKESGLLEYLTAKEEKDVMICGIMTDLCINAMVEAGFEHGLHMIVPAYANSTQDNINIASLYSENWGWKKNISENLSCNN